MSTSQVWTIFKCVFFGCEQKAAEWVAWLSCWDNLCWAYLFFLFFFFFITSYNFTVSHPCRTNTKRLQPRLSSQEGSENPVTDLQLHSLCKPLTSAALWLDDEGRWRLLRLLLCDNCEWDESDEVLVTFNSEFSKSLNLAPADVFSFHLIVES